MCRTLRKTSHDPILLPCRTFASLFSIVVALRNEEAFPVWKPVKEIRGRGAVVRGGDDLINGII